MLNILYDDLACATAETAPEVIAYINVLSGHNEGRPYYMEVLALQQSLHLLHRAWPSSTAR